MRQGESYAFSNAQYNRWIAAHRAVRLYEVAGLATADSHLLELAAQTLAVPHPELAARLILRISNHDQDPALTQVFSRTRVAAVPEGPASKLAQACQDIIEYAIPRIATEPFWPIAAQGRLRVALEVLSRLVLRLEPETVQEVLRRSLAHYQTETIARHSWMADPIRNLLTRSWEALPKERRTAFVFDLLGAPIVGLNLDIQPDCNTDIRTQANCWMTTSFRPHPLLLTKAAGRKSSIYWYVVSGREASPANGRPAELHPKHFTNN